jgi:sulfonate transport system permease protein
VSVAAASVPAARERPRWLGGAVAFAGLLLVWQLLATTVLASTHVVPAPTEIAGQLWDDRALYGPNIETTVREAALGYVWGNALAIALAITFVQVPLVEHALLRLAISTYCMPLVATGPILLIVFSGDTPKAVLAALSVFFTTLIAAVLGLRSADAASLDLIRAYGGGSWSAMRKVRLRASLPSLFAGLQIAAPAALLGAMIGEYLGGTRGLGVAMVQSQATFEVARTWGIACVAAALAGLAYGITTLIARLAAPWAGNETLVVASQPGAGAASAPRGALWRVLRTVALLLFSLAATLGVWYAVIWVFTLDPYFAKPPQAVWEYLASAADAGAHRSGIGDALGQTLVNAGIGYAAGTIAAVAVAVAVVTWRGIEQTFMPLAIVLRSVPLIAMTPLITLVFGRDLVAVTVIVGLVTFFPTLVNLIIGLRSAPAQACDVVAAYGGSKLATLRLVRLQYALPSLFASARIAAPGALGGAILAEWLATGNGLGGLMLQASTSSQFDELWAATVVVVVVSVALYSLISVVETAVLARFAPDQVARG